MSVIVGSSNTNNDIPTEDLKKLVRVVHTHRTRFYGGNLQSSIEHLSEFYKALESCGIVKSYKINIPILESIILIHKRIEKQPLEALTDDYMIQVCCVDEICDAIFLIDPTNYNSFMGLIKATPTPLIPANPRWISRTKNLFSIYNDLIKNTQCKTAIIEKVTEEDTYATRIKLPNFQKTVLEKLNNIIGRLISYAVINKNLIIIENSSPNSLKTFIDDKCINKKSTICRQLPPGIVPLAPSPDATTDAMLADLEEIEAAGALTSDILGGGLVNLLPAYGDNPKSLISSNDVFMVYYYIKLIFDRIIYAQIVQTVVRLVEENGFELVGVGSNHIDGAIETIKGMFQVLNKALSKHDDMVVKLIIRYMKQINVTLPPADEEKYKTTLRRKGFAPGDPNIDFTTL